MRIDELLELVDELSAVTEFELGVDARLDRGEAALAEERDLLLCEFLELKVFERLAAPERQRSAQEFGALLRRRTLCFVHQSLEPRQIEAFRIDAQDVARRLELDRVCPE